MRLFVFITITIIWVLPKAFTQQYFPIKVNKRWGLIDAEGEVVLSPVYEAIGEFKQFGYAVMQRGGGVGLLGRQGKEIVAPRYEDLKVLDTSLVAVRMEKQWMVIDLEGNIVIEKGYERVRVWDNCFLAYRRQGKWGLIDRSGRKLAGPDYDEISYDGSKFFLTRRGKHLGLLGRDGSVIVPNIALEINVFNDSLFFFKKESLWGAFDRRGRQLIPAKYDSYSKVADHYVKLVAEGRFYLYSVPCRGIITGDEYENFYAFSPRYVMTKRNRQLGLLDWCGQVVLSPRYSEIQFYQGNLFRVNHQGKWGIVKSDDQLIIPFRYDYIAPLRDNVCVVKQGRFFGLVNFLGEEVVEPLYDRIVLEGNRAKAYKTNDSGQETLSLFYFDENGQVTDNNQLTRHYKIKIGGPGNSAGKTLSSGQNEYVLEDFEWFYSPDADRWGLRRLEDGTIQIDPVFHFVKTEKKLGLTLVGIEKNERYEFERTTYRFDMVYGLVQNDTGLLVTETEFWDVRLEDFRGGNPFARCVFSDGRHGLVDRIGRVVKRDFAYIGAFHNGVARMSVQGRLSGSMKSNYGLGPLKEYLRELRASTFMVDYTQYDQLFEREAVLTCEDCEWGYIDTSGRVVVQPRYSFARDFINEVGIVACDDKWGMVNRKGEELIPCRYDGLQFLEQTGNRIIRVYIKQPKYGLIDTLGQIAVNAVYDEIGSFSEGRLAVERNGMWGFVDRNGLEVIPCRFREVQNFSDGLAAVKLGNKWGFIDKQGNVEMEFQYLRAGNFRDGLAWVYTGEGAGFINSENEFVIPATFDRAYDFHRGIARVVVDNKYGLINTTGAYIQKPRFTDISDFDRHDLAIVTYGNHTVRYGIINLRGELITGEGFREISPYSEGLAAVKDKTGYGYIDTTGRLVIPCIYSKASKFSEGRAAVQKDGACGYISRDSREIVSFEFTKCLDFDGGKAVVYKGIRRAGLVDKSGNMILEPSVDRLLTFQEGRGLVRDDNYRFYYITEQADLYDGYYQRASAFRHGVAVVQVDDKWGIINQRGIEIIPPKYDQIESFQNGYAKVRIKGFNGLTNLKGELLVQPNYEYISYAGEGLFRVEQGDKIGYFDADGNWVWGLSH